MCIESTILYALKKLLPQRMHILSMPSFSTTGRCLCDHHRLGLRRLPVSVIPGDIAKRQTLLAAHLETYGLVFTIPSD